MIIKKTQHTIHVVLKTVTGGWAGVFEVWTKNADTKKNCGITKSEPFISGLMSKQKQSNANWKKTNLKPKRGKTKT